MIPSVFVCVCECKHLRGLCLFGGTSPSLVGACMCASLAHRLTPALICKYTVHGLIPPSSGHIENLPSITMMSTKYKIKSTKTKN